MREGLLWEQRVSRTHRALRAVVECREGEEVDVEELMEVSGVEVREAWMTVKTSYRGAGGYGEYHQDLAVLMMRGLLEGSLDVGYSPGCNWWLAAQEKELQARREGARGVQVGEGRGKEWQDGAVVRGRGEGWERLVVDFGAGTQAGRAAAERRGWLYIPLDLVEWVWSQEAGGWVRNLVMDLGQMVEGEAWERIVDLVREEWGLQLGGQLGKVVLWMSPPCRTFSRMDAVNVKRGRNYRDHTVWERPPVKGRRGNLAREHDRLVQLWLRVAECWGRRGVAWFMENPVGSLARRPYYRKVAEREGVRVVEVHYCAYGRRDQKPTHILTAGSSWEPECGDGGRCPGPGVCHAMVGARHVASVAGRRAGERERPKGRGSRAARSAVPAMLWEEILGAFG